MRLSTVLIVLMITTGMPACRPTTKTSPEPVSITISVPYEVDSFDPHATITISNFAVLSNFYEPLVRTDPEMKIRPCLARSWENPDSRTWIFELEPMARFHSGKPLTAQDVEFSLNRLLKDPEMRIRAFLPEISEVKTLSARTVRITTTYPVVVFLNKLNFALIVPKGSTPESLAHNIDGTGPYRMNGWKKGEFMRLMRNGDYWGQQPAIQDAMLRLNKTPEDALKDLTQGVSQIVQSNTKKLEAVVRGRTGINLHTRSSLFVKLLGFDLFRQETPHSNAKPNPFLNPLIRKAIHLAVNRTELISRISLHAASVTQPIPPFIFGFKPEIEPPIHDLNGARQLMKQAGLADGFDVTLHTRKILAETAELLRDQLGVIGIRVNIVKLSDTDFFPAMNNREASFYLTRWGCPSGDASDILDDVFHSFDRRQYGGNNYGGFSDPEIDRLIEESSATHTMGERQIQLQHIMKLLMERLPMIPLYSDVDSYATDERISWQPRNDSYVLVSEVNLAKK